MPQPSFALPTSEAMLSPATEQVPPEDPRAHILSVDPERLGGEPCFAGTRVPVQSLWDYLASGESLDVFLDCFPTVTRDQAVAAVRMAAERLVAGLSVP